MLPLSTAPVFDSIIHNSSAPYNNLVWENISITVNGDCTSEICTGNDFFTAMLRGYLVPSEDGDYSFYLHCVADGALLLSTDEDFDNAVPIASRSGSYGNIGTNVDGMLKTAPVSLEAGKKYTIYAVNWVVHTTITDIYWEGPGITKSIIGPENLMYEYDLVYDSTIILSVLTPDTIYNVEIEGIGINPRWMKGVPSGIYVMTRTTPERTFRHLFVKE